MNDSSGEVYTGEGCHHDGHDQGHVISYSTLTGVWVALLMLTALTVAVAGARLHGLSVIVALVVATVKSTLVLWIFMHLKYERSVFKWFLIAALVTCAVFVGLTFADVLYR